MKRLSIVTPKENRYIVQIKSCSPADAQNLLVTWEGTDPQKVIFKRLPGLRGMGECKYLLHCFFIGNEGKIQHKRLLNDQHLMECLNILLSAASTP